MDPNELRKLDFSLDDELVAVQKAFATFFTKEVPSSVVRDAEPLGFDSNLWKRLCALGATSMSLPAAVGGDDAGIVELTLIAEELGRTAAPLPLLDHVIAARLLARAGDPALESLLGEAAEGSRILGLAIEPLIGPQLVSTGAVAKDVVGLRDGELVILSSEAPRDHVVNQASLPSAWCDPGAESVRSVGTQGADAAELFELALRELKVISSAALVGMTETALHLGVEFAKTRQTMGVPIGSLQGVAFPLADVAIGIAGARNLSRRAAWFLDNEPQTEPELAYAAHAYASQVATHGTQAGAHVQGGLGFTVEADASLFFLRAKGWALGAGDPYRDAQKVGELTLKAVAGR